MKAVRRSWVIGGSPFWSGGRQGAQQVCGELVGYAEVGAEGVSGDRSAVSGVVFVGDAAGVVDERGARPSPWVVAVVVAGRDEFGDRGRGQDGGRR